jgi:hypothetical protein
VLGKPNRSSPLPLSFPVKGKDSDAVAGRFLHNLATSAALPYFRRRHEGHEGFESFNYYTSIPRALRDLRG